MLARAHPWWRFARAHVPQDSLLAWEADAIDKAADELVASLKQAIDTRQSYGVLDPPAEMATSLAAHLRARTVVCERGIVDLMANNHTKGKDELKALQPSVRDVMYKFRGAAKTEQQGAVKEKDCVHAALYRWAFLVLTS